MSAQHTECAQMLCHSAVTFPIRVRIQSDGYLRLMVTYVCTQVPGGDGGDLGARSSGVH